MPPEPPRDPFGLYDDAFFADPYPTYALLRREAPVYFEKGSGAWVVTRYADVAAGFRDPRLSASRGGSFAAALPAELRERLAPFTRNLSSWALLLDPPAHTRIRALINKAFTPKVAERLRPAVEELTAALLDDAVNDHGEAFDLVSALANPLPVTVIGDLLGLPRADRHALKRWSDALAGVMGALRPTLAAIGAAGDAAAEMEDYFRKVLAERRRLPGEDLLSQLLRAREDDKLLDDQELLSTCSMLLFGGHETTTNLIANGVLSLLRDPGALLGLRAQATDGAAMVRAVEELLRYDSPVQRMGRLAKEDLELGGQTIRAKDRVFLLMGAAHRDPSAFADPDRLDLGRAENRHLAFGLGAHYCVGAALGRLEAEVALRQLLTRFPSIALAEEPAWMHNATIRGVVRLTVRVVE